MRSCEFPCSDLIVSSPESRTQKAEAFVRNNLPFFAHIGFSPGHMREAHIGATTALTLHSLCTSGLVAGHWLAQSFYSSSLITDPTRTLRVLTVCEAPIVIVLFSWLRRDHDRCTFIKSVSCCLIGLLIGALFNAFGAIVLGAPVGLKYWLATIYWSMLMSLFTLVYLVHLNLIGSTYYPILMPAHGAILGAWPMPLDWERPWQEWPICVTYGAIAGHLIGMLLSPVLIFLHQRHIRAKVE